MNYAIVVLAFVLLLAVVYWFISGRFYYIGPRTQTRIVNGMVVSDDSAEAMGDQEKCCGVP
jgi:uncharacterized membrane protein YqiK